MNLVENVTSKWNSPVYSRVAEQSPSKFIDRFIRLKTTYWNRAYAIVVLAFIGFAISTSQSDLFHSFISSVLDKHEIHYSHYDYISYYQYGYYIGLIPGGVLATVYPAHNILGIFVTISSIGHLIVATCIYHIDVHMHCFLQFLIGTTLAVVDVSIDTTWTYWVPLNKQTIRHVPIILYGLIQGYNGGYLQDCITILLQTYPPHALTLFSGAIGLAWYVLWLYTINGNQFWSMDRDLILYGGSNNPRYSIGNAGVSSSRSIVTEIPWKSIYTSKPMLVIALSYACSARLDEVLDVDFMVFEFTMRKCTIILLLLFVVLVELFPEVTESISTTSVRKFWNCSYFSSMGILFFLEAIFGNIIRTNNIIFHFILKEIEYLFSFGFVNYLDIAPKYGSLLYSFLMTTHYFSKYLGDAVSNMTYSTIWILNEVDTGIMMAIICSMVAVLYAVFGSAELQPWAADDPEEENQQNMVENNNIPSAV